MSVLWGALRQRVLRALQDTDRTDQSLVAWTDDDLLDYGNDALRAVAPHTAQEKRLVVDLKERQDQFAMPDDLLALGPVTVLYNNQLTFLRRLMLNRGQVLDVGQTLETDEIRFYLWPETVLNLTAKLPATSTLTVLYWSYWDPIEDARSRIAVPGWMEEALYWHIQASAMTKPGVQASKLGQYKTRIDAGGPLDNPLLEYAKYALERFNAIMDRHPVQDRTRWEVE